ncbi:DNA damage-inducible protein F [Vibrio stylophorae]|uniref:DNA damage-inducible protein F n=1 Tax=Vibrio stylophorae TaxID=659351 RepID=A0ABM8ZPR2_9VIBR|nr:MATE family efflux transporter DinF [Vibrio stylophorae]CAH0532302.1 DNA damage-inducible protein F [Vibrio stylophorae]
MRNALMQWTYHRQVFLLAIPMVLSNITVPLLGLVDAAVIGHLSHAWFLGGVALGGTMINVTFWLLGFLRMATTGIAAQRYGAEQPHKLALIGLQGMMMAQCLALILLLLHQPIASLIFHFSDASAEVKLYAEQYYAIRIYAAPAALANLVIMGWLLGCQNARGPMWMVIVVNLLNIALDLLFVLGFGWQVRGAALASMGADYCGLLLGGYFVYRQWHALKLPTLATIWPQWRDNCSALLKLNRDIFLRSLCLQAVFSFVAFRGAAMGDEIVAANAVLMSFVMLVSYGMDGFAYAMEAMVGKAVGRRSRDDLAASLWVTGFWGVMVSLLLTVVFALAGSWIISLVTSIETVQQQAQAYLPWLVAVPLVSLWCFLFDGVFVGATRGKDMRNTMFIAMASFFAVWFSFASLGNHALWAAVLVFLGMRGLTLAIWFSYLWRKERFLPA